MVIIIPIPNTKNPYPSSGDKWVHRTPGVAAVKMVKRRGLYELSIDNYITHLYAHIAYPAWIWNFPTWQIWTRKDGKSSENGLPHSWHASGRNDWRLYQYADIARYLRWTLFLRLFKFQVAAFHDYVIIGIGIGNGHGRSPCWPFTILLYQLNQTKVSKVSLYLQECAVVLMIDTNDIGV